MDQIIGNIVQNLDNFILMFLRTASLIVSSPIFGRKTLPNKLKIGFCLLLTYVVFAAYPAAAEIKYSGVVEFALLCIKELLFGLVLGYVTTLFFSIVQTAGHIIDMQIGFGMVSVLDVQNNISVPITGNFLNIILLVSFFSVNGHQQLISIIWATFKRIPVGTVALDSKIATTALAVFAMAFLLALNVAMPIIASGLLGEIIMGFVVRTVPQMNVFVVGIPLKIILGFLALLIILPVYVSFTNVMFRNMFSSIESMLLNLVPVS